MHFSYVFWRCFEAIKSLMCPASDLIAKHVDLPNLAWLGECSAITAPGFNLAFTHSLQSKQQYFLSHARSSNIDSPLTRVLVDLKSTL